MHIYLQLVGKGFTIQKFLEEIKVAKPISLTIGTHHFVQMSEIDLNLTGLDKTDLSSVLWIMPVGASVPPISFQKLQNIFPNLKVSHVTYPITLPHHLHITNAKKLIITNMYLLYLKGIEIRLSAKIYHGIKISRLPLGV